MFSKYGIEFKVDFQLGEFSPLPDTKAAKITPAGVWDAKILKTFITQEISLKHSFPISP